MTFQKNYIEENDASKKLIEQNDISKESFWNEWHI